MKFIGLAFLALVAQVQAQDDSDNDSNARQREVEETSNQQTSNGTSTEPRIVVYYQSVYQQVGFDIADIDGNKMTHFVYSFLWMEKNDEGEVRAIPGQKKVDTELVYTPEKEECDCCAKGTYRQAYLLKKKYPHLKTILSIGGWSQSDHFSDGVYTAENRKILAESITKFMIDYEFDGIDIDWEYPTCCGEEGNGERDEDGQNLALFISELRSQWEPYEEKFNRKYELTVAIAAALPPWLSGDQQVLQTFINQVDYLLIMGYEYNWGGNFARHQANLYDIEGSPQSVSRLYSDKSMKDFASVGFDNHQLVLGVAAYCRQFTNVESGGTNGLLQPGQTESSIVPYREQAKFEDEGFQWHWDDNAKAGWYYNEETKDFWSCEDRQSVSEKSKYVTENNYGGIMVWDIGNDIWDGGDKSLLEAIKSNLPQINWDAEVDRGDECPNDGKENTFCNMGCADELESLEKKTAVNDDTRQSQTGGTTPSSNNNNKIISSNNAGTIVASISGTLMIIAMELFM